MSKDDGREDEAMVQLGTDWVYFAGLVAQTGVRPKRIPWKLLKNKTTRRISSSLYNREKGRFGQNRGTLGALTNPPFYLLAATTPFRRILGYQSNSNPTKQFSTAKCNNCVMFSAFLIAPLIGAGFVDAKKLYAGRMCLCQRA